MATVEIGICSGPHRGRLLAVDVPDGQQPPAERVVDGQRLVLDWGGWESGMGPGQHYCPRDRPPDTT